ncbi:hypothetical protein [Streptomyces sp. NPDC047070]|uniref:hypothetical protein n=1 Tax=Streptomyces sp. NPDC047070 TaxID=3154923 RepID=UPI0034556512
MNVLIAAALLAPVVVVAFLAGLAGGWRWAGRAFLFGLVVFCVEAAVIEFGPVLGEALWGVLA